MWTLLIDLESALDQFCCIQFVTKLGQIITALLLLENTLAVCFGCSWLAHSIFPHFFPRHFLPSRFSSQLFVPKRCPCCDTPLAKIEHPQWGRWPGPLAMVSPWSTTQVAHPFSHSPRYSNPWLLLVPRTTRSSGKILANTKWKCLQIWVKSSK